MGWTSYWATHYKKDGKVDVKAELDPGFCWTSADGTIHSVEKSSMVGTTYYAAIREKYPDGRADEFFPAVIITSTKNVDGTNFAYKDIGPYEYDCPEGILKILDASNDNDVREYVKLCREEKEKKKKEKQNPDSLKNLPIGSVISFVSGFNMSSGVKEGDKVSLTKYSRDVWGKQRNGGYGIKQRTYWTDGVYRWTDRLIPKNFTVERRGVVIPS